MQVLECPVEVREDAPLCDQFNEWLRTRADDDQHGPPPSPTPSPTPTPTPPKPREVE